MTTRFVRVVLSAASVLMTLLALVPRAAAQSYWDAYRDFSATSNPSGPWSYGRWNAALTLFSLLTTPTLPCGGEPGWGTFPVIWKNTTGSTVSCTGSAIVPATGLVLHPSNTGERAALRWTAPANGSYLVQAKFLAVDVGLTTVAVAANGVGLGNGSLSAYGQDHRFSATLALNAGDWVDFMVDSNGVYSNDSVLVDVLVEPRTAGIDPFGHATYGCVGGSVASGSPAPQVGTVAFAIRCGEAPASAIGLLAIGFMGTVVPLPVLGIDVWIDPGLGLVTEVATTDTVGTAVDPVPIPGNSQLIGSQLYCQYVWFEPTLPVPCPASGFSASTAIEVTILP